MDNHYSEMTKITPIKTALIFDEGKVGGPNIHTSLCTYKNIPVVR